MIYRQTGNCYIPTTWLHLGLQRFVDVIDYVDYKNTSINMECVDALYLATPIAQAYSYSYLRLFFCHV